MYISRKKRFYGTGLTTVLEADLVYGNKIMERNEHNSTDTTYKALFVGCYKEKHMHYCVRNEKHTFNVSVTQHNNIQY